MSTQKEYVEQNIIFTKDQVHELEQFNIKIINSFEDDFDVENLKQGIGVISSILGVVALVTKATPLGVATSIISALTILPPLLYCVAEHLNLPLFFRPHLRVQYCDIVQHRKLLRQRLHIAHMLPLPGGYLLL